MRQFSFLLSDTILSFWSCLSRASVEPGAGLWTLPKCQDAKPLHPACARLLSNSRDETQGARTPPKGKANTDPAPTVQVLVLADERVREELSDDMVSSALERRVESLIPRAQCCQDINHISKISSSREEPPTCTSVALLP